MKAWNDVFRPAMVQLKLCPFCAPGEEQQTDSSISHVVLHEGVPATGKKFTPAILSPQVSAEGTNKD